MLDSFEKESKLHSRRAARARQMKLMEEAAAGLPLSDEADQYSTTSSNNLAPDNIAERFSIDDDGDEDEGPPSIFTDTASSHLWSSRTGHDLDREELNFVLGTNNNDGHNGASAAASSNNKLKSFTSGWTSRKEHEESRKLIMMASRRLSSQNNVNISPFGVDRDDDDDDIENNAYYQQQRHRIILPMCCLDNLKFICALSLLAVALVAIIVAPSVLVNRNNTEGEVPWNPWAGGKETPLDMARFDRIKDRILEHRISHASVLEDPSSPQYKALAWLVRDDERHVDLPQIDDEGSKMTGNNIDDEIALFQRYALAVFWFQTTDAEIVEESLGMTVENPRDIAWNNADGWMTSKGLCLWYGVTCHPHQSYGVKYDGDFHVAMLNLTSNNIHGVLPDELFTAFLKMTVLDLHQNELAGTLGRELANMLELEDLFLNGNSFEGQLPDNIGALRSLQNLNVHDNEFDGPIPVSIGELENLRELGMFNNQFSGRIPLSIGNLKNLIALYLESNQLTGNIPPVIGQLTALEDIRLRNNMLNGPIPTEIGELKELRTLYLDTNKLSGAIPTELGTLYKLDDLQMYENELKGSLPVELAFLSGLTTLYLDANGLTGSLPEEYGEMHALEELIISSNQFTGELPATIRGMKSLKNFRGSDNQFQGKIPIDIGKLLKLEYLMLDSNQLTGVPPVELGELKELKAVHLHDNNLSGEVPEAVCDLRNSFFLNDLQADCEDDIICACCTTCH
mmetsp:Transcript_6701/g.14017  ORF Transcript_6701/g.14017 Transcript_6701/m.14017 type:complete len:739 (+) Transcript_6701:81-2297(+)